MGRLLLAAAALAVIPVGVAESGALRTDLSTALIPVDEIVSGGPPPDGIPAIDRPGFVAPGAADAWLKPKEPVLALEVNGDARAYPLQILVWHEIVNDTVGGRAVAVTYCPLCNSGLVFDRTVDGVRLDFGTSGKRQPQRADERWSRSLPLAHGTVVLVVFIRHERSAPNT